MYCKKSTPIIIALLLCWSQTSNSFKLPNWLIAGSIVGIGSAYFFAKTYKPSFNSLWERLFARNPNSPHPISSTLNPPKSITPPTTAPSSSPVNSGKDSINKVKKFIDFTKNPTPRTHKPTLSEVPPNRKVTFDEIPLACHPIRLEDPITGQEEYTGAEYCPDAKPKRSCLKPISRVPNPVVPSAEDAPSLTPIPATMPSTPEDCALIPFSHAGQLRAQQNPEQPNTFWLPPELLALFNNKGINPLSPLCIHLFDGKQTITFKLPDIHTFPDAIQKSPETAKMLLSAQHLLGEKQASALAFLLEKAVQGLPIEFDTKLAITDSKKTPTVHRREYSTKTSAYGGKPNKDKKPSAYGGTRNKPQQFDLTVQQGNKTLRIFSGTHPKDTPHFSDQINAYNSSITPTEDLIDNALHHRNNNFYN